MKAAYFTIFALMIILVVTCYNWGGTLIVEGALAGAGMAIGTKLDEARNKRKEGGA